MPRKANTPKAKKAASKAVPTPLKVNKPAPATRKPKTLPAARSRQMDRYILLEYMRNPEKYENVVYYNDDWVLVHALYPRSRIHTLLLPRNETISIVHPAIALSDPDFLADAKEEVERAKTAVAELCREMFGSSQKREWEAELRVGVHMKPSLWNLHIHIMTPDIRNDPTYRPIRYASYVSRYFAPLSSFPVKGVDSDVITQCVDRWQKNRPPPLPSIATHPDLHSPRLFHSQRRICWRCNQDFSFKPFDFEDHLNKEADDWIASKPVAEMHPEMEQPYSGVLLHCESPPSIFLRDCTDSDLAEMSE